MVFLACGFLTACSNGLHTYQDDSGGSSARLSLAVQGLSSGVFSDNGIRIDLYGKADKDCVNEYLGSIFADSGKAVHTEISAKSPLFGSIVYDRSSFWSGDTRTAMDFVFTPKRGYRYTLTYQIDDDAYDVTLLEQNLKGLKKELALEPWPECRI